jgi:hypothetical protein
MKESHFWSVSQIDSRTTCPILMWIERSGDRESDFAQDPSFRDSFRNELGCRTDNTSASGLTIARRGY